MKKIYLALLIFVSYCAFGQVSFSEIPMDSALVARDTATNKGTLNFQGSVNNANTPYDSLVIKVYRAGILIDSVYQALSYSSNIASFSISYQIPAELEEYKVDLYGIDNALQTLDTSIDALLAGDVYIIDGQSNAFAQMRDGGSASANKSEFIRSFASADSNAAGFLSFLKWGMGEPDGGLTEHCHVGQWGIRVGRLLIDSMKMPIAIFSEGCGGTPITYYMRPTNYKTNLNSNYGRLYYKFKLTSLQNNVRAIMWSQGETDGKNGTSISTYITEFDTLQRSWKQDFPGFRKTYIFQTRNGGMPTYPFLNLQMIKEAEREIAVANDSDVEIISTSSLRQDSGDLHFDYKGGYEIFGNRLYNLIARDIYHKATTREINSPMITAAYMKDSTTLIVIENADSLMRHNPGLPITDYEIENAGSATIDTIYLEKNKIIFRLSRYPGTGITISYLAQPADSGNWVTNTNEIEVLCYYKHPVTDSIIVPTSIAVNNSATVTYLQIYPNPFHGTTNVIANETGEHSLEVYNIAGEKVLSTVFTGAKCKVNALELANGLYFVRVYNKEGSTISTAKLIVE